MDAEWNSARPGKLDIAKLVEALKAAAAPTGVHRLEWEVRRASLTRDQITRRYGPADERDDAVQFYADEAETANITIAALEPESRDSTAIAHLSFDGAQTRIRVESPSVQFLERLREHLG